MLPALVDYNDTSSALKYWSKITGVQIGSRLDQKIVGFLDRKNMGLVKWYTWPFKFLLRTGRYATALNDVERGRISSSLLFIPMLPPWPFSRHAVRSRKIREFSFIIPLTLDTRTHTNMDVLTLSYIQKWISLTLSLSQTSTIYRPCNMQRSHPSLLGIRVR